MKTYIYYFYFNANNKLILIYFSLVTIFSLSPTSPLQTKPGAGSPGNTGHSEDKVKLKLHLSHQESIGINTFLIMVSRLRVSLLLLFLSFILHHIFHSSLERFISFYKLVLVSFWLIRDSRLIEWWACSYLYRYFDRFWYLHLFDIPRFSLHVATAISYNISNLCYPFGIFSLAQIVRLGPSQSPRPKVWFGPK